MSWRGPVAARTAVLLCGNVLLAFVVRLYRLGHENFWIDEVFQVQVASQSLSDIAANYSPQQARYGTHEQTTLSDQAPLSFFITHFFLSPFETETMARLPSAIFGTLGVLALFSVAYRLVSPKVALLATFLLAISPIHIWYSQEARWYALWGLLSTLSYLPLINALQRRRVRDWFTYGFLTLLNLYTFVFAFLVIASQAVTTWWQSRRAAQANRVLESFALVHLLVACAAAPVLSFIMNAAGAISGTPRDAGWAVLPYTFFAYAAGFSIGPTVGELHALPRVITLLTTYPSILLFFVVFLPLTLIGVRRVMENQSAAAVLLPWLVVPPVLVFAIGLASDVTYQVRYSLASLPAFVLIIAQGASSLKHQTVRRAAIAAVSLCSTVSVGNYYWHPRYGKEDVRAAVGYIRDAMRENVPVIVAGQIHLAVQYYGPDLDVIKAESCGGELHAGLLGESSVPAQALWIIAGRDWADKAAICRDKLSLIYNAVEHRRFTGVALWLLLPHDNQ